MPTGTYAYTRPIRQRRRQRPILFGVRCGAMMPCYTVCMNFVSVQVCVRCTSKPIIYLALHAHMNSSQHITVSVVYCTRCCLYTHPLLLLLFFSSLFCSLYSHFCMIYPLCLFLDTWLWLVKCNGYAIDVYIYFCFFIILIFFSYCKFFFVGGPSTPFIYN